VKILLVEDDKPTAAALLEVMTAHYYTVDIATDGQIGLQLATSWDYDLILLDWMIPKLDGISLCRQLRTHGLQKPILLLTAKASRLDIIQGLDAGADDYVTKPYDLSELLARIRALLRRETNLTPILLSWGDLQVNPISAEVVYQNQALPLSPKEYALLSLFLRNPKRVFSRSDIIDRLWSMDSFPSEGAVTNLIKDLRHKLRAAGITTDLLETVYGLGYRLKSPPQDALTVARVPEEPISEPPNSAQQTGTAAVNRVLERYRHTFADRVMGLQQIERAWRTGTLSQEQQQSAAQEAHKLAGTLGSFGYAEGSKLAQTIEYLLMAPLSSAAIGQFSTLVSYLQQVLTQPPTPLLSPAPSPVVLVISPVSALTHQLQQDAVAWGLQIEMAEDVAIAQQKIAVRSPQTVVLSCQAAIESQLSWLWNFRQQFPQIPVLVLTEQESLMNRVALARLGVQRFLPQSIAAPELLVAITQVLGQSRSTAANVMVLDDDQVMLDALKDLLQPWGVTVTALQDATQFWDVLVATQPDLLILDLEMPNFSGIDLCRVVRQDARWSNLPILVVTAHTDAASNLQVFAAGADDLIGKPIAGPELVTRVISRIDRSRLQPELRGQN
jgi:DNA-binding response OmpR family regulator